MEFQPVEVSRFMNVLGWHSRGYLPHYDGEDVPQHVTFHLSDSLPQRVLKKLDMEIDSLPPEKRTAERRERVERWLDAGYGSCILRIPAIAELVQNALLNFDASRCCIMEWAVMPNHVHVLSQPVNGWKMSSLVSSWKKYTGTQIIGKADLGIRIPRPLWHREYWDRYIRNDFHFQNVVEYVRLNPVKAGLASKPDDWRWSSAFHREHGF